MISWYFNFILIPDTAFWKHLPVKHKKNSNIPSNYVQQLWMSIVN